MNAHVTSHAQVQSMSGKLNKAMGSRHQKCGFTLVEFLVVFAIMGILSGFVLTAVQAARESARRMQCADNLRQVGVGVLQHHGARMHYPSAGSNSEDFTLKPIGEPDFERLGWGYQILPYIGQSSLHDAVKGFQPTAPVPSLDNRALVEIPVSTYTCPSRGARVANDRSNGINYALGDYAGIQFGYLSDQWKNSHNDENLIGEAYKEFAWRSIISKGGHNYNGAYHKWPTIRVGDVADGTSHTLVAMEKSVWSRQYSTSTDISAAICCEIFGWAHNAHLPTMRSIAGDGGLAFGGTTGNWASSPGRGVGPNIQRDDEPRGNEAWNEMYWEQGFGSAHADILTALFGDGSVRGIQFDVDISMGGTLFRLGCRDDGMNANSSTGL
jgi:prepilin-type N-terminal cleavage/methylation domain-containing protein